MKNLFIKLVILLPLLATTLSATASDNKQNNLSPNDLRVHYMDICLMLKFYEDQGGRKNTKAMNPGTARHYLKRLMCHENKIFSSFKNISSVYMPYCDSSNKKLQSYCDDPVTLHDISENRFPDLLTSENDAIYRMIKEFTENHRSIDIFDSFDGAAQLRSFGDKSCVKGLCIDDSPENQQDEEPKEETTEEAPQDPSDVMM